METTTTDFEPFGPFFMHNGSPVLFDENNPEKVEKKPLQWKSQQTFKQPTPVATKPKSTPKKSSGGKTKADIVLDLFKEHKPKSRKEGIALIVDLKLMGEAGASTYCSNANKVLQLW